MSVNDSLGQRFPQLPFAQLADNWLSSLEGKSILEQLRERRIIRVNFAPLLSSGGLGVEGDNFFILLNDLNSPEENASTLGHEIGHTFYYDSKRSTPAGALTEEQSEAVEEFCDRFSVYWLAKNGKERVVLCCKNQASLISLGTITISP